MRSVRKIEELSPELKFHPLDQAEVLEQRNVSVLKAWSVQNASARVAVVAGLRDGRIGAAYNMERIRVKPLIDGLIAEHATRKSVRPDRRVAAVQDIALGHRKREPGAQANNAVRLPAGKHDAGNTLGERLRHGDVVQETHGDDLGRVKPNPTLLRRAVVPPQQGGLVPLAVGEVGEAQVEELQRPLALRARALISDALAEAASNQLQPGRRLAAANDAARDWALLSRIDPGDTFSKNSLMNARTDEAAQALWNLGRPRESLAKVAENAEFEAAAEQSTVVASALYFSVDWAAYVAAELGQAVAADKYLADRQHLFDISMRSKGPASFLLLYFRTQTKIKPVQMAMLQGDLPRARAAAKGLREELLQLPVSNDYERLQVAEALNYLHSTLGWVALQARDFSTAQEHFSRVAETRKQLPAATVAEQLDAAYDASLLAITLAHAGRLDEARSLAEPALARQRDVHARQTDDQMHKLGLSLALLAAARATPDRAKALLGEAQAAFDSLPAEARDLRSSQRLQSLIADARVPKSAR